MRRLALLALLVCGTRLPAQPAPAAAPPLDAAARRVALDSAAVLLAARYPVEARAHELRDSLRAWARRDAFAGIADPARFADTLGRALRGVVQDKHLYLRYTPGVQFAYGQGGAAAPAAGGQMVRRTARIDPRDSATVARSNFGFARVEILEGNVGHLDLDKLTFPDWAAPTADAALAFLRHTDAVIIDVRDVPGGAPQMTQYLVSHFFDGPRTLLHASYARGEQSNDSLFSLPELATRGLGGKPLYIVTSGRSGSAAEMLPYVARRLGIATIVGETTSGAGNGGRPHTIGPGLQLFVPERQVLTGPGWEQTGVAPDVAVPAAEALERAHALARERIAARTP